MTRVLGYELAVPREVVLSPLRILVHLGSLEGLFPEPVVLDSYDPPVAQGKDVEDLAAKRLAANLVKRGTTDTHHDATASPHELQRRHIATKPESCLQRFEDFVRTVTDPILVEPLPGHFGIEYCAGGLFVAYSQRTEIVEDDGLEIPLALADHGRSPRHEPTAVGSRGEFVQPRGNRST